MASPDRPLPPPTTVGDEYQAAAVAVLKDVRALLTDIRDQLANDAGAEPTGQDGAVQVTEPAPSRRKPRKTAS